MLKRSNAVVLRELLNKILGFNCLKNRETTLIDDFLIDYKSKIIHKICKKLKLDETFVMSIVKEDK